MASLFGALDTAVSGLTSQSAAFGNISDNIANSQTNGFKRTDTTFADYLSTSTAVTNDSGSVVARPEYQNETQGTISSSTDPLALAISGQGFFQVSQQTGSGSASTLNPTPEYSRDGDFTLDSQGYMVNGSQEVLNGWISTGGVLNQTVQAPIQISQAPFPPVATANVTLSANLPATPAAGTGTAAAPITSQINVYDKQGTEHTINLAYSQNTPDNWTVSATDAAGTAIGTSAITFNTDGTLATPAAPASISLTPTYDGVVQTIAVNVGPTTGSGGLTQYAGTSYQANSLTQDGIAPGNYSGVATQSNGNVVVSYDNGQSKIVAKVPVIQFADANALQRQNGQGFTPTVDSGVAVAQDVGAGGGTTFVAQSVEGSNVDIATEFTKLIVAQQAYAANSKVVTTANDMLTQTINMKQ